MKLIILITLLWGVLTHTLFLSEDQAYPKLKDRFGNLMWQSDKRSDIGTMVNHTYCYYPKEGADSSIPLIRQDSGDCSNYLGQVILPERDWQSELDMVWLNEAEYHAEIEGNLSQNTKNQEDKN